MQRGCRTACRARALGARAQRGAAPVQRARPAPWSPGHSGSLRQSSVPGQGAQAQLDAAPVQRTSPASSSPAQRTRPTGPAERSAKSAHQACTPPRRQRAMREGPDTPNAQACSDGSARLSATTEATGARNRWMSAAEGALARTAPGQWGAAQAGLGRLHHRSVCRPADSERADSDRAIGYPAVLAYTRRQYLRHTGRQNPIISTPGTQARCQDPNHQ